MKSVAARHHAGLVVIHWAMAALILGNYAAGRWILESEPNGDGAAGVLAAHIFAGLAIVALFLPRLLLRVFTRRPPGVGSPPLRIAATATHWLFYLVIAATISTGFGLSVMSGALPALFSGGSMPTTFSEHPPQKGHALFANVLLALVLLHILAALYHQFVRRDGLLGRMWFGQRWSE